MTESSASPAARRRRGVVLNELDRTQPHVIAYSGRRWETVGTFQEYLNEWAGVRPDASAGERSDPSTAPDAREHAVRAPWSAVAAPSGPQRPPLGQGVDLDAMPPH